MGFVTGIVTYNQLTEVGGYAELFGTNSVPHRHTYHLSYSLQTNMKAKPVLYY